MSDARPASPCPISPPGCGGTADLYQCYVEFNNRPWEVYWKGSQRYPDFDEVPLHPVTLSEEASTAWSLSSLVGYGSHGVIREYDEGGRYPIAKIAHPNSTARRLVQHEYEIIRALSGVTGIAKIDSEPLTDKEGIFGFRLERLWKIGFKNLASVRGEVRCILDTLHDLGYCHGDLSPSNVMRNESGQAVLIDLSFAGVIGQRIPSHIPSWAYNSEVFEKRADDDRLEEYFR